MVGNAEDRFSLDIVSVPSERGVISKERSAGSYRLSAYYIAKTVSELPLQIIMPTLFYTYIYWMTGLGGVTKFFMTWPMLLLATITGQVNTFILVYLLNDGTRGRNRVLYANGVTPHDHWASKHILVVYLLDDGARGARQSLL